MKKSDCLFSDIRNLCNAVFDWLIQKITNPIETNETISCACCHIMCDNRRTSWTQQLICVISTTLTYTVDRIAF